MKKHIIDYSTGDLKEHYEISNESLKDAIKKPYLQNLLKVVSKETVKEIFRTIIELKIQPNVHVSLGNIIEYDTSVGKQQFLNVFVDTNKHGYKFIVSNYEILQYEEVKAASKPIIRLSKAHDNVLNSNAIIAIQKLLFCHEKNYKHDWTIYNLAKEVMRHDLMENCCYTQKAYDQEEELHESNQLAILDYKKPSGFNIKLGENIVCKEHE